MSESDARAFEELNLRFGQTLQLQTDPEAERLDCVLLGCLPGETVILSFTDGEVPVLEEGQQVFVRALTANGVAVFSTRVLFLSEMPLFQVYLDYPATVKYREVRNNTRVEVVLPVLASSLEDQSLSGIAGKVSDLSLGGAQVMLYEDIGEPGDSIQIKTKLRVAGIHRITVLEAIVRRKRVVDGGWAYGLEFERTEEEELLIMFGFIYQMMVSGSAQTVS